MLRGQLWIDAVIGSLFINFVFFGFGGSGLDVMSDPEKASNVLEDSERTIMVAGLGIITFRLHDCRSLKGKRKIVKSIIAQLRNHFNVSVAEVGANDIHQRAVIGFAMVGNNRGVINSKIDKIFNLVDDLNLAEVVDSEMEIINL